MAFFTYFFKIWRPLRNVKFTINLTRGDKLIGRFYYILHGFFKQKLTPPLYQNYPNPFLIKERRKSENLSLKSFFRKSEQPSAIHFPCGELQCFSRGDPRDLCVNTRIRLLTTHSLILIVHKKYPERSLPFGRASRVEGKGNMSRVQKD